MRDALFGLDSVSHHDEGQAYLCTAYDSAELQVILGILDSAEIPFLLKDRGAGGVSRVIMGFTLYGTDVFVPEAALDEAEALVAPALPPADFDGDADAENTDDPV